MRVYGVIASYANESGLAWPGKATIAQHLDVDKSNVKRAIKRLIEAGHVVMLSTGGGHKNSNKYRIQTDFSGGGLYTPVNDPNSRQKNLPKKGGLCAPERGVHMTPKENTDIIKALPPSKTVEIKGDAIAPSQDVLAAPGGAIKGDAIASAQSGAPDPHCVQDLARKTQQELSSGGAKPKSFDPSEQLEAVSKSWARDRLIKHFGIKNGAHAILLATETPDHPEHKRAVAACLAAAAELKIHWTPPKGKNNV